MEMIMFADEGTSTPGVSLDYSTSDAIDSAKEHKAGDTAEPWSGHPLASCVPILFHAEKTPSKKRRNWE